MDQLLYKTFDPLCTRSGRAKADSYVGDYDVIPHALLKTKGTRLVVIIDALDVYQKFTDLVQVLGKGSRVNLSFNLILLKKPRLLNIMISFVQSLDYL